MCTHNKAIDLNSFFFCFLLLPLSLILLYLLSLSVEDLRNHLEWQQLGTDKKQKVWSQGLPLDSGHAPGTQ